MSAIDQRASFDFIRYANCWEDADILLAALDVQPGDRCLSVASGGDNSFSLLTRDPSLVVAADLNPAQLACVELKREAFRKLDYESTLAFLGFREMEIARTEIYRSLRDGLSESAREFWDRNEETIANGVIHAGKFERYFAIFRRYVLPLVHSRSDVRELMREKSPEEREQFYNERWDTWRWRAMFRLFFSRRVMGLAGRDPEFFRYVEGSVADRILERTRYALTALPTHDNPYVRYILTGSFGDALPHYVRPENFAAIRRNLDALHVVHGSIDAVAVEMSARHGPFNRHNLSDVFEYMPLDTVAEVAGRLIGASTEGGRLAYWNMLAPRRLSAIAPERIERLDQLSRELHRRDRAFFYSDFHVDQIVCR